MSLRFSADAPLGALNTLRLPSVARLACEIRDAAELPEALDCARRHALPVLALGGGSNVVLQRRIEALVLCLRTRGVEVLEESAREVRLSVAAGEPWHPFVLDCHARGWHGLENLALIPGTVGAAPIQNIGAYGVELAPFVREVHALALPDGAPLVLGSGDCAFGYRDSVFKGPLAGRALITRVVLALPRAAPCIADYPALRAELGAGEPTPARVLAAVIALRRRRLPDPAELPNAGSFFKNPVVPRAQFEAIARAHPGLVHWALPDGRVKLAAAWLIDRCGWKGRRAGNVGVHAEQALVLVNPGGGDAPELLALAARVRDSVRERFGVALEIEPVVCG